MNSGRTCKSNIYLRTSIFLPAQFVSSPHILRLQISKSERWKSATYSSLIDDYSSYFKRSVQESRSIPSHKTKPQSQPKVVLILALWKSRIPNPAHLLLTVPLESPCFRGLLDGRKNRELFDVTICPHLALAADLPLSRSPPPLELAKMRFVIINLR